MTVKIKKSDPPESTEILAKTITDISEGMNKLLNTPEGLTEDAIIVLLHDKTKLPKGTIKTVLRALPRLRGWYCRQ